jgi:hypothetical protein
VDENITPSEALKQIDLSINAYKNALIREAEREAKARSNQEPWLNLGEAAERLGYNPKTQTREVIELCYDKENKLYFKENSNGKPYKLLALSVDLYLERKARGEL